MPPPDLIFPVAHNVANGMHLLVLRSALNVLLFSADLFCPQITPPLAANPFMDLSFRKQYAKCIHSQSTLSFWQCLPKPKMCIPFDVTIPLLEIYPTEILAHVHKDIVHDVCNINTNSLKKVRHPSGADKLLYSHTTGC